MTSTNGYLLLLLSYSQFQDALGLRKVTIYDFSRLNLKYTILSKRNLSWLVDNNYVEGWNDPRFPTVQGILRRGLTVQTLTEFMLEQGNLKYLYFHFTFIHKYTKGPSKNTNLMEWDKLWATNKKNIDPVSGRYTAIS
jgi:glutamyl-tRNA synthetase